MPVTGRAMDDEEKDGFHFHQRPLPYAVFALVTGAYVLGMWYWRGQYSFITLLTLYALWGMVRARATTWTLTDTHLIRREPWRTERIPREHIFRVTRRNNLIGTGVLVERKGGFGGVMRISFIADPDRVVPRLEAIPRAE